VLADLYGYPSATDITLVCTNVRSTTGKRPVWADDVRAIFYFPWTQIRFLEIPQDRTAPPLDEEPGTAIALRAPDEADLEIDEEFLKRVRDV
jgi:hypothetical protein